MELGFYTRYQMIELLELQFREVYSYLVVPLEATERAVDQHDVVLHDCSWRRPSSIGHLAPGSYWTWKISMSSSAPSVNLRWC